MSLSLDDSAATATELAVELTLGSSGPYTTSAAHVPGKTDGVLRIDPPLPYMTGEDMLVTIRAIAPMGEIGNSTIGPTPLAPGCTSLAMRITPGSANNGDGSATGEDLPISSSDDFATPDLANADLAPAQSADLSSTTGILTGSLATTSGTAVNLTSEGTADWAHWGTATANSFDHRTGVTMQISNFTNIASTGISQLGSYSVGFTWADGTPTAIATNSTTGIYTNGNGAGFRITAPAGTTTHTLRLYAGGQQSTTATVTAHLSDGSAADYMTSTAFGAGDTGMTFERTVTLVYRAAAPGQTLTVTWAVTSTSGFVHLHSATLQ